MAWKNTFQQSFADSLLHEHDALTELDDIQNLIDWSVIERQLSTIHNNPMGERAWPPLVMFKILLLQAWYRLSDPACEKQLVRDLLFRRFVGLSLQDTVPDHSTIWRFRNILNEEGHLQPLLNLMSYCQIWCMGFFRKLSGFSFLILWVFNFFTIFELNPSNHIR